MTPPPRFHPLSKVLGESVLFVYTPGFIAVYYKNVARYSVDFGGFKWIQADIGWVGGVGV
jgi:hypothetical protein